MSIALWIAAGLLALAFLAAGAMKLIQSKDKLAAMGMDWSDDFSAAGIKGIATLEVLGALGVILPAVTGILPVLVPVAATGLVLVMIGAIVFHLRRGETQAVVAPLVLALLAAFVAVGRFWLAPFGG